MQDQLENLNDGIIHKIESKLVEMKKTDKWLADTSGIVPAGISQILSKKRIPTLKSLMRIASALNMDMAEFFDTETKILFYNEKILKVCLIFWILDTESISKRIFTDLLNNPQKQFEFLLQQDVSLDWFFSESLNGMHGKMKKKLIEKINSL